MWLERQVRQRSLLSSAPLWTVGSVPVRVPLQVGLCAASSRVRKSPGAEFVTEKKRVGKYSNDGRLSSKSFPDLPSQKQMGELLRGPRWPLLQSL